MSHDSDGLGVSIPQGSIVSSLLCSFHYGHLERNVIIPYLEKASEAAAKDISRRHISSDASAEESRGMNIYFLDLCMTSFSFQHQRSWLLASFPGCEEDFVRTTAT